MTLEMLIALAFLVYIFGSLAVAAGRGDTVAEALLPVKSFKAFCWQIVLLVWVCLLAALQLYECPKLLGQQPMTWALLFMVIYAWICLGYFVRSKD